LELVNFKNISANHVIVSEMGKRQTSGMAGVYYVAAELSTLGYTALVTTRNAKAADIIAINGKTGMTAAI
jgi:hypothetical protein